jgi:hypothetical protein
LQPVYHVFPLDADRFIRQVPDPAGLPLDDHDFEAVLVIQMNVQGGNNHFVMGMLVLSQLVGVNPNGIKG